MQAARLWQDCTFAKILRGNYHAVQKNLCKGPLSKRPKIGFQDQLPLNAGQKLGEHSAILSTFIKPFVIIPAFFLRKKKGILNFVPKSVRRPSVCVSVRPCGCASVMFLVYVSPPKQFDIATSNFVAE